MARPRRTLIATVLFALGALVGWPFAIAISIPFVLEEIFLLGTDRVNQPDRIQFAGKRLARLVGCGLVASLILVSRLQIHDRAKSNPYPEVTMHVD